MQPSNHQQTPPIQQKKKWYTTWWGILLIIFVYIPIGLTVFMMVLAVASYEESNDNSTQSNQQKTPEESAKQQAEDKAAAKKLTKTLIESYVPKYCETHQQRNVPLPPADGEQYGEGKNYLTTKECRAIITYLVDRVGSSAQSLESISNAEINIGMNRHELLMAWGLPRDINSTHTAAGERAQWVYNSSYVYLENDVITVVQN